MIDGTYTAELRECPGCNWWTRWLSAYHRCQACTHGWTHCTEHGRWEHTTSDHVPVTARDVIGVIPDRARGEVIV